MSDKNIDQVKTTVHAYNRAEKGTEVRMYGNFELLTVLRRKP